MNNQEMYSPDAIAFTEAAKDLLRENRKIYEWGVSFYHPEDEIIRLRSTELVKPPSINVLKKVEAKIQRLTRQSANETIVEVNAFSNDVYTLIAMLQSLDILGQGLNALEWRGADRIYPNVDYSAKWALDGPFLFRK